MERRAEDTVPESTHCSWASNERYRVSSMDRVMGSCWESVALDGGGVPASLGLRAWGWLWVLVDDDGDDDDGDDDDGDDDESGVERERGWMMVTMSYGQWHR